MTSIKVLLQTGTNFFQGLYPPLGDIDPDLSEEKLNNGSETTAPLNGYQYVQIHGKSAEEPDTIWIKGDDDCPVFTAAAKTYKESDEYISILNDSRGFYEQFTDILDKNLPAENVSFAQAYDVFDLLNVGSIHNESVKSAITTPQLDQLRYYADASEFAQNYNETQPDRSIGGMTLVGGILRQMNQTVSTQGKLKLSIFIGSYDTFLAFFGLTNLTAANPDFMGLPVYASSLAFELFTEENMTTFPTDTSNLRVRFLFRNGTDAPLTAYPLFDRTEDSMPYADLTAQLASRSINSVAKWCSTCQSTAGFCSQDEYAPASKTASPVVDSIQSKPRLTNAQAGVVGAMTTLGVVALLAAAVFFARRTRSKSVNRPAMEKRSSGSEAGSGASA